MSKSYRKKSLPGQRIAKNFQPIIKLEDQLSDVMHQIQDHIYEYEDGTITLDVENGRPVVVAIAEYEDAGHEGFRKAINRLCEDEDPPQLEKWAEIFEKAAEKVRAQARECRNNP